MFSHCSREAIINDELMTSSPLWCGVLMRGNSGFRRRKRIEKTERGRRRKGQFGKVMKIENLHTMHKCFAYAQ